MFDRGLLSLDDDYSILLAKGRVPEPVHKLINPYGKLKLPARREFRPHPQFLGALPESAYLKTLTLALD